MVFVRACKLSSDNAVFTRYVPEIRIGFCIYFHNVLFFVIRGQWSVRLRGLRQKKKAGIQSRDVFACQKLLSSKMFYVVLRKKYSGVIITCLWYFCHGNACRIIYSFTAVLMVVGLVKTVKTEWWIDHSLHDSKQKTMDYECRCIQSWISIQSCGIFISTKKRQ